jgi:UDP-N-acetylglucosamine:LPS N-acetylglucosamine transferase
MHQALHEWDYSVLKKLKKHLRQGQKEFENAVAGVIIDESEAKAKELAELIEILLEQDEIHWLQ